LRLFRVGVVVFICEYIPHVLTVGGLPLLVKAFHRLVSVVYQAGSEMDPLLFEDLIGDAHRGFHGGDAHVKGQLNKYFHYFRRSQAQIQASLDVPF